MPRVYHKELTYSDGRRYVGTGYDKDGEFVSHGRGTKYDENGGFIYDGYWVNGEWNGEGKWYYTGGSLYYEGSFLDGKPNGSGKIYYENGTLKYEGDIVDDQPCGRGKWYRKEDGTLQYEGDFVDGNFNGKGKFFYSSGVLRYEGEVANDFWQGFGTEYAEDGSTIYEGHFVEGHREGQGKWYYDTGALYYEGAFQDGNPNGKGKCFYPSGELWYEGDMVNDKKHGQGRLYDKNGQLTYEGLFADDEPAEEAPPAQSVPPQDEKIPEVGEQTVDAYLKELESMIGLAAVKRQVRSLINLIQLQKERERRNFPVTPMSYHMVFTGNPGTGKTTVARLIGKIYASLGILSKGNVVETDRAGLVDQYIGGTAQKTEKKFQEALGGVLFIDEAYALAPKNASSNDFGSESVDCLLKRMEDYRDNVVVIAAGYEEPMQDFLETNPGLKSRFNHHIQFEDYTLEELVKILELNCQKENLILRPEARELFIQMVGQKLEDPEFRKKFSNGRYVRNLFEKIIIEQGNRLSRINLSAADDDTLREILADDFQALLDNGDFDRTF